MSGMRADELQAKYGAELAQPPFAALTTARQVFTAFKEKYPRSQVGEQAFKTWISKYRLPQKGLKGIM